MRGRTIFLFASFAFPIIATPVPTDHIDARRGTVERRSDFSITQLYRELFKREPLIEALPKQASYGVADKIRRITTEESVEACDDKEVAEVSSDNADKRSVKFGGGGPTKRRIKFAGGGPGKRASDSAEDDVEKRRIKFAGGGPGKRSSGSSEDDVEKRRIRNAGGGPIERRIKFGGGGPSS